MQSLERKRRIHKPKKNLFASAQLKKEGVVKKDYLLPKLQMCEQITSRNICSSFNACCQFLCQKCKAQGLNQEYPCMQACHKYNNYITMYENGSQKHWANNKKRMSDGMFRP